MNEVQLQAERGGKETGKMAPGKLELGDRPGRPDWALGQELQMSSGPGRVEGGGQADPRITLTCCKFRRKQVKAEQALGLLGLLLARPYQQPDPVKTPNLSALLALETPGPSLFLFYSFSPRH
jgi:hypothetical protein